MFTSRAEFRLSLRADNADQRLTPKGIQIGCVSESRQRVFEKKMDLMESAMGRLTSKTYTPRELNQIGLSVNQDGARRSVFQLLSFPDVDFEKLMGLDPTLSEIDPEIRDQLSKDALYANYIDRQQRDVDAMKRDEDQIIPDGFSYEHLDGLSNELKKKLIAARPRNLAQAGRVEGMTPAALTLLLAKLRQDKRNRSA
jgi:tRNA uridine 5-carboxymethylaminomethyl modification enzyme